METSELSGTNSPKLSAPEFPVSSSAVSVFCPIYVYFTRSFRCLYRRCLPLPIPNRAVKPARADGTAVTGGRVGRCRSLYRAPAYICRGFFYGSILLSPSTDDVVAMLFVVNDNRIYCVGMDTLPEMICFTRGL